MERYKPKYSRVGNVYYDATGTNRIVKIADGPLKGLYDVTMGPTPLETAMGATNFRVASGRYRTLSEAKSVIEAYHETIHVVLSEKKRR